nr:HAD-IIB family hydrolase [Bacillus sonorensis]
MDGTICFEGQPVSEHLLMAFEELKAQGHEVIFASARPIRDLLPVLHERFHHDKMVGGNGSMVAREGKIMSTACFDDRTLSDMMQLLEEHRLAYLIDSDWDYAYTGPAGHPILKHLDPQKRAKNVALGELRHIVKILLLTSKNMKKVEEQLGKMDVVVHVHANEGVLDVSPRGVDKWSGLQQLGIKLGEYIAFGNDANDIPMFKYALYAVMVGHHPQWAPFSSEQLPLHDHIEHSLVQTLAELGRVYSEKAMK